MNQIKLIKTAGFKYLFYLVLFSCITFLVSCTTLSYKTYTPDESIDDPEPDYNITLNPDYQEYTSFMFIGNRVENFGTYFNTFYNAKENYLEAYEDYELRILPKYNEQIDSIYQIIPLSQESIDKFNKAIEKASKVLQYHKSSAFMDQAVLLIGKSYYYLGDYLKAERKFNEFISKLTASSFYEEALLYYARTQFRLYNPEVALTRVESLIKNSTDKNIIAGAYQTLAEYYISKKDFETAIKNYKKSIEYSSDKEFKAQMQFLIASVAARTNNKTAASEFKKVLDYNASYDLEYLARYNYVKNLILSNNLRPIRNLIGELEVDYKENVQYLGEIKLLSAVYYDQNKSGKMISEYSDVIKIYPKTAASSDASYSIGKYYESNGDFLTAYKYYRYALDENSTGHYFKAATEKVNTYRRYYELRSKIAGTVINTEYDSLFLRNVRSEEQLLLEEKEREIRGKEDEEGRPGGLKGGTDSYNFLSDSSTGFVDTTIEKDEEIARAQFELAELFVYDLNNSDSAEYYLKSSFEKSHINDFKSKVLFALASLYKNQKMESNAEEVFNRIIIEFPATAAAEESRKQLGQNLTSQEYFSDGADSLYTAAEILLENKEYRPALDAYNNIIITYPSSVYTAKSYYAMGWIYENALNKNDSAYLYYSKLIEKDPNSELTKIVGNKVLEYMTSIADSSALEKDTLQNKPLQDSTSGVIDSNKIKTDEIQNNVNGEEKLDNTNQPETDPTKMKKDEENGENKPEKK